MPGAGGPSFKETLSRAMDEVSGLQENARDAVNAFIRGEPVELHDVMAAAEEAGIALDMLVEIRNKLTQAYQAVVQMQS
jgi:flagellar hook-basal body complex protein FliE